MIDILISSLAGLAFAALLFATNNLVFGCIGFAAVVIAGFFLVKDTRSYLFKLRKLLFNYLSAENRYIVILIALFVFGFLFPIIGFNASFIVSFFIITFYFKFDNRSAFVVALISLIFCPFLLIIKQESAAELFAIFAYYFLWIGVIWELWDQIKGKLPAIAFNIPQISIFSSTLINSTEFIKKQTSSVSLKMPHPKLRYTFPAFTFPSFKMQPLLDIVFFLNDKINSYFYNALQRSKITVAAISLPKVTLPKVTLPHIPEMPPLPQIPKINRPSLRLDIFSQWANKLLTLNDKINLFFYNIASSATKSISTIALPAVSLPKIHIPLVPKLALPQLPSIPKISFAPIITKIMSINDSINKRFTTVFSKIKYSPSIKIAMPQKITITPQQQLKLQLIKKEMKNTSLTILLNATKIGMRGYRVVGRGITNLKNGLISLLKKCISLVVKMIQALLNACINTLNIFVRGIINIPHSLNSFKYAVVIWMQETWGSLVEFKNEIQEEQVAVSIKSKQDAENFTRSYEEKIQVISKAFVLPKITVPRFALPAFTLPTITIPQIKLPHLTFPKIVIPQLSVPKISLPQLTLPNISVPQLALPIIPKKTNFIPGYYFGGIGAGIIVSLFLILPIPSTKQVQSIAQVPVVIPTVIPTPIFTGPLMTVLTTTGTEYSGLNQLSGIVAIQKQYEQNINLYQDSLFYKSSREAIAQEVASKLPTQVLLIADDSIPTDLFLVIR